MRGLRLAALALTLMSTPALAHRERSNGAAPPDALSIPSLTHGQMNVIANHLADIAALAEAQTPTDSTMRRLQGFVNLQSFVCLWGRVPGSLTDEASPFNECAHAYLAGARALLQHLRDMQGPRAPVNALVAEIEVEMLANGAALSLCRYSDEPFNTAELVLPRWRDVPRHAPSALTLGALLALCLGAAASALRWLRASSRLEPPCVEVQP